MNHSYKMKSTISAIVLIIISILLVYLATIEVINYAVASLFLGVALIVPFLILFEQSRIKCQMLVLIATLSSLAIVGRWAFSWLPNVTLSTGIVILAGVSLGGVPGFMVGVLTMFVSNMLLGQGLWTIWQMLLVGIIGLTASMFRNSDKLTLSIFALFVGFAYGFIMDIFTLVTVYNDITWQTFLTVWAASFYFDLVHGISSIVTIILFYNAIVPPIRRRLTK